MSIVSAEETRLTPKAKTVSSFEAVPATENVILTTAAVWLGLLFLSVLVFMVGGAASLVFVIPTTVTLGAVALCWWMTLVRRTWRVAVLVAAATVGTLAIIITAPVTPGVASFAVAALWLQLNIIAAALLLKRSSSILVIAGVCSAALALMVLRVGQEGFLTNTLIITLDAFSIGMAISTAVYRMRHLATETDKQEKIDTARRHDMTRERAHADEEFRWACLVHDTAINTLGAVAAGLPADAGHAAQRRAQSDLAALSLAVAPRSVHSHAGLAAQDPYRELIDFAQRKAHSLSLRLDATYDQAVTPDPTDRVLRGMEDCVAEAFVNVAKHSGVADLSLRISSDSGGATITITDRGTGFNVGTGPKGKPVTIAARARRAGLDVRVQSSTSDGSAGTAVSISWRTLSDTPTTYRDQPPILIRTVVPLILHATAWLFGLYVVEAVLLRQGLGRVTTATAVAVAVSATVFLALLMQRKHRIPGYVTAVTVALIAPVTLAPVVGLTGCSMLSQQFWAPNCGLVLCIVLIVLSGTRRVVVAAATTYIMTAGLIISYTLLTTSGCGNEGVVQLVKNMAAIAGAVLLRRFLSEYTKTYDSMLVSGARDETNRIRFEAAAAVRTRWTSCMLAVSLEILNRIAVGEDVTDAQLRKRCSAEESFLRAMLIIPGNFVNLGDAIAAAAAEGRERSVLVTVNVLPPLPSDSDWHVQAEWVSCQAPGSMTAQVVGLSSLVDAVRNATPGDTVTITVSADPGLVVTVTNGTKKTTFHTRRATTYHEFLRST